MGILASGNLTYETFRMMNIYTPARTTPYAPWWQNHSEVERAISIPKVAVPAPPDATPSAATSSPQPDAALAKNPPINEGKAKLSEKNGKLANAQTSTGTGVRPVMNASPEAWKMFGPLTQQRLKAGQAWVAQAGINRWFVQLVHTEANQFAGIESFIQKAESALGQPNVHAYFVNESGVNYVVVTYGDFSSEADATAAINNLPREVRVNRPYSRQLINLLGGNPGTVVN
jgi:septal ring-binding cell division protein DamX